MTARKKNCKLSEEFETPTKFWKAVKEIKSGERKIMFPNLPFLMLNLLCLPHSSATVDRERFQQLIK